MTDRLTHGDWCEAVADGRLFGLSCPTCGAVQGTPKAACPHCGSRGLETVQLPTEGEVYTETTINVPPSGIEERGYQVAVVQFGAARVIGRLVDQDVDIGDTVRLSGYDEDQEGNVTPRFEST